MRKLIVFLSAILLINSTVCYANDNGTANKSFIVNINNNEATMHEEDVTGINNTMLPVKVIKYIDDIETIIFTGNLGDYDNGIWANTDFSKIQFLMVLDWETNDTIYIIPLNLYDSENETTMTRDNNSIDNESISQMTDLTLTVSLNTKTINNELEYDYTIKNIVINNSDGNRINVLKNNANISSVIAVKNTTDIIPAKILAAIYNDKRLINVCSVNVTGMQEANDAILYNLNIPLSDIDENSSVKIMVWDTLGGLKPYALSLNVYSGYNINLSTDVNQIYTIPITSNSDYNKFKIKYDPEYFEIDDLCKSSNNKITTVGNATENIRIDSIENGSFTFSFIGNKVDNCINHVSLKALKSGNSEIKVYEIDGPEE